MIENFIPEIVLISGIVFLLFLHIISKRELYFYFFSCLLLLFYTGVEIYLLSKNFSYDTFFNVQKVQRLFSSYISLSSFLSLLLFYNYNKEQKVISELPLFLIMSTTGMVFLVKSSHLFLSFLAFEFISFTLYIMIASFREMDNSYESALKYFILGSFASLLFLSGLSLIYGAEGDMSYKVFYTFKRENPIFITGVILLFTGIAFKLAFVPFHLWTPDVFEGSPFPFVAFISVAPKIAGFGFLLNIFRILEEPYEIPLILITILTMIVGNITALFQKNMKRLMAYSSIAHTGYIGIGFLALKKAEIESILFYLFIYIFMQTGAFAFFQNLKQENLEYENIKGLYKENLVFSIIGTLFFLSLLGIPPTAGFFSKFYIFLNGVADGYYILILIALINVTLSSAYYLKIIYTLFSPAEKTHSLHFSRTFIFLFFVTVFPLILAGILPNILMGLIRV